MDYAKESLKLHGQRKGKIKVVATVPVAKAVAEAACASGIARI